MSEKLAVLGRLGAEELADVLNLLFSALLADAAAYGGSLLKYGGDAVLLFFEGDDHAARGAAATHQMRATLRRLGTIKTSRGTVRVRMSVGIHSGDFDFFLVGDSHKELIVTGPGATETTEMETTAEAGQILISPSTAALLADSCVGEPKGDGFLLKRKPRTPAKDPLAWGVVPDVDPIPFIPVGLRNHIGGVGTDAEHRHIAVGFVAFGGVDELLAAEGGEKTAEVLEEFISACQAAFDRYDACFLYADVYGNGGKVFFIVGAPVSHEDNEERVLRAALEISSRHHHGLHLHTGLNRGYVFAGDIGAEFRRTYTVLGDAVNTAARVMASCNADAQIRSMPEVLDLASSRFATETQAPFAAKGKALPLQTYAVGEALGPRLADTPLELVGREDEMAWLRSCVEDAEAGNGALLNVVGDAGVGKSRLVEELRLEANDVRDWGTVTTFAEKYEQSTVYFVLRQLYAILFDGAENDETKMLARAEELAPNEKAYFPLLGRVFGLDIAETETTKSLPEDAVARILGRMTVAMLDEFLVGPSLWVAENAHLADEASAGVISNMAGELEKRPWLLIAVRRDGEDGGLRNDQGKTLTVPPLSQEAATRLARIADPTLLPHDASTIAERSDGNPLFLRQLVSARADGADLADSVETAVSARIDRLSTVDRDVLRTAAVLGGRFDLGDLREVLDGRTPDLAPLNDFLMTVDDGIVFRQALYREVAYAGLTFRRRRALHLAAGRLLEGEVIDDDTGPFERLSMHFDQAQAWEQSWKYSRIAGDKAKWTMAKSVAAQFYERALTAGRKIDDVDSAELGAMAGELARMLTGAGRTSEAREAVAIGRRLVQKPSVMSAQLVFLEAASLLEAGDIVAAAPRFRRAWKELEAVGEVEESVLTDIGVRALLGLADCTLRTKGVAPARRIYDQATGLIGDVTDQTVVGIVHAFGLFLAYASGDLATAVAEGELALEAFRRHGEEKGSIATHAMNLGALKGALYEWDEAGALYAESKALQQAHGNDMQAALTQVNMVELFVDQGRWADAAAELDDVEPVLASGQHEDARIWARGLRTRLNVRTNNLSDTELPDPSAALGTAELIFTTRVEAAMAAGDAPRARNELMAAAKDAVDVAHLPLIEAALRGLEGGDRVALATEALEIATEQGDVFAAVVARTMLGGSLADDPDAQRLGLVDVPAWAK